jgi:predicted MarR family transcription regulator
LSEGKDKTITGLEDKIFEAEIKITLGRSGTSNTVGPEVTRWMGRAYAAPLRSQIFSVPLLMHHKVNIRGREYFQDVDAEMQFLRDMVDNPRIVAYQENEATFSVIVENVQFEVLDDSNTHNRWDWEGTATVIMRSVA